MSESMKEEILPDVLRFLIDYSMLEKNHKKAVR